MRGGPFYKAQHALRLIRLNEWNLGRRIMMLTAVTWLPLVLLTALLNPVGLGSLLRDYRVYSRFLIAIPVLLIGKLRTDLRFRAVFSHIRKASLLEPPDLTYMDNVIRTLVRLRDSLLPEPGILVLLIVDTAATMEVVERFGR